MRNLLIVIFIIGSLQARFEQWLGVYVKSYKIGYTHIEIDGKTNGYEIRETTIMDLKMLGQPKSLNTTTVVQADKTLNLKSFEFFLSTGDQRVKSTGKRVGNSIKVLVEMNGRKGPSRELSAEKFLVPTLLHARMILHKPIPKTFKLYDPSTFTIENAQLLKITYKFLSYRGKKVKAKEYVLKYLGYTTRTYVYNGRIIRDEGALGIVSIDEPEEDATKIQNQSVDLLRLFAVVPEGNVPQDAKSVELELSNINPNFLDLTLDGQKLVKKGKDFAVIRVDVPDLSTLPSSTEIPDSVRRYLMPDEFMQSDDPRIRDIAINLTSGLENDVEKVERIKDWVYNYIEKKPTVTIPSALEVLESKRGDCNEHAVLFGAVARAAGIPTQIVVGLIYANGAYYYHAWNAVWIGGKWIFVDSIFNEFPASARHIMLKTGGIDKQTEIISIVGRIKIKVLNFE